MQHGRVQALGNGTNGISDPGATAVPSLLHPLHERRPAAHYITGPRSADHVEISEVADGAVVPELEVGNESSYYVLLLDGETLLGARQNRIVTTSVLVPPRRKTNVPVTCVEAGRWGAEQPVGRSNRHAPSAIRARNRASVHASAVAGRAPENDQAGVWEEVDRYALAFDVDAPTRAMEDVHALAADRVRALVGGTKPLAGQRGVAAAIGGEVVAVDLFDDPQTLADYWDALVAGYALDADEKQTKHPRRRDVRRMLAAVVAGRGSVGDGRVHVEGDGVVATALLLDDVVVHLAAGPVDRTATRKLSCS